MRYKLTWKVTKCSLSRKPDGDRNWINAGYFVCEPEILEYIPENDDTVIFERKPLENLAKMVKCMLIVILVLETDGYTA